VYVHYITLAEQKKQRLSALYEAMTGQSRGMVFPPLRNVRDVSTSVSARCQRHLLAAAGLTGWFPRCSCHLFVFFFVTFKMVDKFCWPVGGTQLALVVAVKICVCHYLQVFGCPSVS
jgi:hypothetical protein